MPDVVMEVVEEQTPKAKKRKLIDPDDDKIELPDPKRPAVDRNTVNRRKCFKAIVQAYEAMINEVASQIVTAGGDLERVLEKLYLSINTDNNIMNCLFTSHQLKRQGLRSEQTNIMKKAASTDSKIMVDGNAYIVTRVKCQEIWDNAIEQVGLKYKAPEDTPKDEAWIGIMGPLMDFLCGFPLRVNELRVGHSSIPTEKKENEQKAYPIHKYGLNGAHHVLLEGCTFPPEKRSSMVQSLGPMTALLCMIRSPKKYRSKFEAAVKRDLAHIPCIDDIILLTENQNKAGDVAQLCNLIAEILLITTSQQATRMFFPIAFLRRYLRDCESKGTLDVAIDEVSFTGRGGFYMYKILKSLESKGKFTYRSTMTEEMASQVVFHGVFGTYKEDFGVLSAMTDVQTWYTREQMGKGFQNQKEKGKEVKITLPKMHTYSKMSCANQSRLLTGVYNQVSTIPCFSGPRRQNFSEDFFEHIQKRTLVTGSAKSIPQIVSILSTTLTEVQTHLRKNKASLDMGTATWNDMESLTMKKHGAIKQGLVVETTCVMFMGKPRR